MRILFLTLCIISGLMLGLWWTGFTPFTQPTNPSANTVLQAQELASTVDIPPSVAVPQAPDEAPGEAPNQSATQSPAIDLITTQRPFSYNEGIMRVAPSVVSIYASQSSSEGAASTNLTNNQESDPNTRQGSGVIVDEDGIVLTNLHLVNNFDKLIVVLSDGRQFDATIIGSDQETDLAVVKIEASMLPAVPLGEAQPLRVGDIVLAIGNPFGVGQTVTQGIVSATRRRIASGSVWQNFIQIDAAINPGNSGGALINPFGQLVGVNTAVFRGDSGAVGIGYAIPAELLSQVVPQIIENGSVTRGWLGLGVEDLNMFPALSNTTDQGVVITAVRDEGPAFQVGVKPMDIVVQLGEQPVSSATQLLLAVSALPPGATVKLVLLRGDRENVRSLAVSKDMLEELTFKVKLGSRPEMPETSQ